MPEGKEVELWADQPRASLYHNRAFACILLPAMEMVAILVVFRLPSCCHHMQMLYGALHCIILLGNHMTMQSNTMVTGVQFILQSMEPVHHCVGWLPSKENAL